MEHPKKDIEEHNFPPDIFRPRRPDQMRLTDQPGSIRAYLRRRRLGVSFEVYHGSQTYVTMEDFHAISVRQERIETLYENAVQPLLNMMANKLELLDAEPPAASAAYDWGIVKGRPGQLAETYTNTWNAHVNQAIEITSNLLSEYDDLPSRLSQHVALIECVKRLVRLARSYDKRHLARAALTISDALHSVYAEDLTKDQVDCICDVTQQLLDDTKDVTRDIDRQLRSLGFETIPSDRFRNSVI